MGQGKGWTVTCLCSCQSKVWTWFSVKLKICVLLFDFLFWNYHKWVQEREGAVTGLCSCQSKWWIWFSGKLIICVLLFRIFVLKLSLMGAEKGWSRDWSMLLSIRDADLIFEKMKSCVLLLNFSAVRLAIIYPFWRIENHFFKKEFTVIAKFEKYDCTGSK